ncbi:C40 family peptidase [Afifella pfennigii]|uniref:hypothetical protein n=1 Tax=Afifella pfennigii TaxID=209897 RepID=UPI00047E8B69|nr:hypothetical protein [Afifella pfennigii]
MSRGTATLLDRIGHRLARWLEAETGSYDTYATFEPAELRRLLKPGDIVLVEGRAYISQVVKYLTQSTWSHSALFVGDLPDTAGPDGEPHCLIEVDASDGCVSVPLSRYATYNVRICRPSGLSSGDRKKVTEFMIGKLGLQYDMKNIFDLMRYFLPLPLPARWRRRAISFGSGDPTRAICSSLIAEAYQKVGYPILPVVRREDRGRPGIWRKRREIYFIRHHSLFAPRDFDLSPYFAVVKPTLQSGFNYKRLTWAEGAPPEEPEKARKAAEPASAA